jgi:lysophospholipase L1-like esterase
MDPNSTGRDRLPYQDPAVPTAAPRPRLASRLTGRQRGAMATAMIGGAIVVIVAAAAVGGFLPGPRESHFDSAPRPPFSGSVAPTSPTTPTLTPTPTMSPTPLPTPLPTPSPTPAPTAPPLPALLGAVGDSYSQAWSVSPQYLRDHTQFSWVIGTDKGDGVFSILERFQALGGSPTVVDAATSGMKMDDAPRQADAVVAAASKLAPGKTAYVTFELGINDLCASPDFMTDPASFAAQLQTAISTLRTGLPAGSRILMLSVPDFPHFRDITQADPAAKALLALPANQYRCEPYLGLSNPSDIAKAHDYLARYDASLEAACADINAHEGSTGRLRCTYNSAVLADSDFTIEDLSTYDYFHPSLSGQRKMAEDAWTADAWASLPLPTPPV